MHDRLTYLIKHNRIIQFLYRHIMSFVFKTLGLFIKQDEQLVLLSSFGGEQYSDSTRVIYEAMLKDRRFDRYHFLWVFDHPDRFTGNQFTVLNNERTEFVKIDTLKYFVAALKSKVWITNVNIERGLHFKKKNIIYLNTWHGTAPKKGGNAYKGRKDYDFSYVDILCVDGDYERDVMLQMYNADEKNMLWCGRPREDELFEFTEEDSKRVRKSLNIPEDMKLILYMPTWREGINHQLDWGKWEAHLVDEYVMLVRAHHFSKTNIFATKRNGFWVDVSDYPNVNELYWIADMLISDYSSAIFDYGLLGRPVVSFAKDHDEYMREYGLFMANWADVFPHGVMKSDDEVIGYIEHMNYKEECLTSKAFCDSIVSHPGNATKACLDRLNELL